MAEEATKPKKELLQLALDVVDFLVEHYFLPKLIQPFLKVHEVFYGQLNATLRKVLDDNKPQIPAWFTANFITYLRTWVVFPTLLLLAWGHTILPAILVILVDFGDFLDGVVARFWVDVRKEEEEEKKSKGIKSSMSLTDMEVDSFEVVSTGSPRSVQSWVHLHRDRTYGGFIDAVCDKAYVVPCWISLTHAVGHGLSIMSMIQYGTLFFLILAETASACIRFRAFFTSAGVSAPTTKGFDFSSSAVKADHVGKAKQTFEMVGTALFIMPWTRYIGLLLLVLALPLAYESVRRKVKKRIMYVYYGSQDGSAAGFDHKTLKFWSQAKAMGASKLIVGITAEDAKVGDHIFNACACSVVDEIIVEAPKKVDLMFMERRSIDFVLLTEAQQLKTDLTTEEVMQMKRVLVLGKDGVVRPAEGKNASKSE
eukprot:CAMPEP_0172447166 /NCGR_PEP_ID=MMETSP1065-20121228/6530_1 /TAXON_ID=265537 /ORGANISM="Amphiprora paludosa, Strain CCMP125" /LENGTH=424 /DNA_ID=CAMNT_0013198397 /DNA_START=26 /DNA_END=1300 /DNA_ORIENTATION=-